MKYLVTGGAGYIGSHIASRLIESGHDVTVIDNLSTGFEAAIPKKAQFINSDFASEATLKELLENNKFSAALHLAAFISVPESTKNPGKYFENNFLRSSRFFDICLKYSLNNILLSSTAAVYDEISNRSITEADPLKPINPYGESKLGAENSLIELKEKHPDLNFSILRYFNVAGAKSDLSLGQYNNKATHLIKMATKAALGIIPELIVYGDDYNTKDGTGVRDYIHIEDLVDAHILVLDNMIEKNQSRLFNCGYGKGFSVLEVVQAMKKVSGEDFNVKVSKRRPGDAAHVVANSEKLKSALNWVPKFDDIEKICLSSFEWEKKLQKTGSVNL